MVKYSAVFSAALLVAAVGPTVALPANIAARAVATPTPTPTATTSSAAPTKTLSAAEKAAADAESKKHASNSKDLLEWMLKQAIQMCHKNGHVVICLETLGSFYFQEGKADEDKAVQLEGLMSKFGVKPPPALKTKKTTTTTTTTTTTKEKSRQQNNNRQGVHKRADAFTEGLNAFTDGKTDPTVVKLKQGSKRGEDAFVASLLGPSKNDPVVAKISNGKRAVDPFTEGLNAFTDGKTDPTVVKLKQGSKRGEDAFVASLLGPSKNDPVVAKISNGKRAVQPSSAELLLKRMKGVVEDICAGMKKPGVKDICYMKIGSILFAGKVAPEDKATNLQGLISQFEAPKQKRDLEYEMEARDFDDELEARDFDDEFEARDFDEELYGRDFYLDLEDLD